MPLISWIIGRVDPARFEQISRIELFPGRESRSRKNSMDVVDGENGTAQSRENCRQRGQRGRTDKYTSVPISWCRSSLLSGNYRFRFKRHTHTLLRGSRAIAREQLLSIEGNLWSIRANWVNLNRLHGIGKLFI